MPVWARSAHGRAAASPLEPAKLPWPHACCEQIDELQGEVVREQSRCLATARRLEGVLERDIGRQACAQRALEDRTRACEGLADLVHRASAVAVRERCLAEEAAEVYASECRALTARARREEDRACRAASVEMMQERIIMNLEEDGVASQALVSELRRELMEAARCEALVSELRGELVEARRAADSRLEPVAVTVQGHITVGVDEEEARQQAARNAEELAEEVAARVALERRLSYALAELEERTRQHAADVSLHASRSDEAHSSMARAAAGLASEVAAKAALERRLADTLAELQEREHHLAQVTQASTASTDQARAELARAEAHLADEAASRAASDRRLADTLAELQERDHHLAQVTEASSASTNQARAELARAEADLADEAASRAASDRRLADALAELRERERELAREAAGRAADVVCQELRFTTLEQEAQSASVRRAGELAEYAAGRALMEQRLEDTMADFKEREQLLEEEVRLYTARAREAAAAESRLSEQLCERTAALERAEQGLQAAGAEVEELEGRLSREEALRERESAQEVEARRLSGELTLARGRAKEMEQAAGLLRSALAASKEEAAGLSRTLEEAHGHKARIGGELEDQLAARSAADEGLHHAHGELKELEQLLAEERRVGALHRDKAEQLERQLSAVQELEQLLAEERRNGALHRDKAEQLERQLYAAQELEQLLAEERRVGAQHRDKAEQLERHLSAAQELERHLADERRTCASHRDRAGDLERQLAEAHDAMEALRDQAAHHSSASGAADRELQELRRTLREVGEAEREAAMRAQGEEARSEEMLHEAKSRFAHELAEHAASREALRDAHAELRELEQLLAEERTRCTAHDQKARELGDVLSEARDSIRALQAQSEGHGAERQAGSEEVAALERKLSEARAVEARQKRELGAAAAAQSAVERGLSAVRSELEESERRLREEARACARLDEEARALEMRHDCEVARGAAALLTEEQRLASLRGELQESELRLEEEVQACLSRGEEVRGLEEGLQEARGLLRVMKEEAGEQRAAVRTAQEAWQERSDAERRARAVAEERCARQEAAFAEAQAQLQERLGAERRGRALAEERCARQEAAFAEAQAQLEERLDAERRARALAEERGDQQEAALKELRAQLQALQKEAAAARSSPPAAMPRHQAPQLAMAIPCARLHLRSPASPNVRLGGPRRASPSAASSTSRDGAYLLDIEASLELSPPPAQLSPQGFAGFAHTHADVATPPCASPGSAAADVYGLDGLSGTATTSASGRSAASPSILSDDSDEGRGSPGDVGGFPAFGRPAGASPREEPIPDAIRRVMAKIDANGWDQANWEGGFTLLHWAAKQNRAQLCTRFVWQGADPHQKDHCGKSAIDYAREYGAREALAQLRQGLPLSDVRFDASF